MAARTSHQCGKYSVAEAFVNLFAWCAVGATSSACSGPTGRWSRRLPALVERGTLSQEEFAALADMVGTDVSLDAPAYNERQEERGAQQRRPVMSLPTTYYDGPADQWRMCDRCHMLPAAWVVNPGTDAGLYAYCDPCMPGRWKDRAQPYTPDRNHDLDEWTEFTAQVDAGDEAEEDST
jgi:hypothetical protein